ncbi:MAG: MotB family protein [Salinarimonas sp.]
MDDKQPQEIVIVRRKRESDLGDGKNTVWKIAFADFMTAMMAFFLVMWLVNVTDDEAKEMVANYFNPINLAEATSDRKGLRDPESSSSGVDGDEHSTVVPPRGDPGEGGEGSDRAGGERPRFSESELFHDPYAVLAELAAELDERQPPSAAIDISPGESGEPGLPGGDAFRDPFDPVYWQTAPQPRIARADGDGSTGPRGLTDAGAAFPELGPGKGKPATEEAVLPFPLFVESDVEETFAAAEKDFAGQGMIVIEVVEEPAADVDALVIAEITQEPLPALDTFTDAEPGLLEESSVEGEIELARVVEEMLADEAPSEAEVAAAALRAEIAELIQTQLPQLADQPLLEVRATPEGMLISLTDAAHFGMFAIGSAEPKPEVVGVLRTLAQVLLQRPEPLVIRGHTDGRPFRSANYDNWRLSTARAHMAYHMLVHGGFDETRISRVEGHADRMLKVPDDPDAAENRRIEILLLERPA